MCVEDIKFNVSNDILEIEFLGKSFYRYMVRNMVGAMLEVGMHKKEICDVSKMLDDYMVKTQMMTAPACGLYLMDIEY